MSELLQSKPGKSRRAALALVVGVSALVATACPPPPLPSAPVLPVGVGVQWLRDVGGTLPPSGSYQPSYQRWSVLGGVVNGPTPATLEVLPATYWAQGAFIPLVPDGTARFPWNGFAGIGVTDVTSPNGIWTDHTVTGPAGSCVFTSTASNTIQGIVPSPDGSKVAILDRTTDWIGGPGPTRVTITGLVAGCPSLSSMYYTAGGDRVASPAFVWAPDSSGVLYPLVGPAGGGRIARLNATTGAAPQVVLDEGTAARVIPLGWSITNRMLFSRSVTTVGPPAIVTSTLETLPLAGGSRYLFDTFTGSRSFQGGHFGYFVPGTTTVAYNDAGETRVNATGETVPWFRVRLYDDTTGGKGPLLPVDPPFGWHDEAFGQMPNAEMVEGFVR